MSGNGEYNRNQDARMNRERQQQEHQAWLASLTPEQLSAHNTERRRLREEGQRAARIWAETTLRGRNVQNVLSDEEERLQFD
jgi:hypothetical protein